MVETGTLVGGLWRLWWNVCSYNKSSIIISQDDHGTGHILPLLLSREFLLDQLSYTKSTLKIWSGTQYVIAWMGWMNYHFATRGLLTHNLMIHRLTHLLSIWEILKQVGRVRLPQALFSKILQWILMQVHWSKEMDIWPV